jgi:DNA polymerase-3 subunit delta'
MNRELPWFAAPWAEAAHALKSGRMPAGLLIHGRQGIGRERLAGAIARARLCLEPRPDAAACGHCAACREMDAGAHPDFLAVHLLEDKTQILIEQIRELTRALNLTAGNKGARCALISPAERLNPAASNALLKTLEEPPAGVSLMLIADSPSRLLPTVVSRCLRLRVPVPPAKQALPWLDAQERRPDWPLLLALGAKAPLAAQRLAEEIGDDFNKNLKDLLHAAAGQADPVSVVGEFKPWPLARFAALIGWLTWAALRTLKCNAASAAPWWPSEIAALAAHADPRRLLEVWREANWLSANAAVLNADLARERLVLLLAHSSLSDRARK